MADTINSGTFTLDQLEAMASDFEAIAPGVQNAVDDLINELEAKINEIDALGTELTAVEETQFFKGSTQHSHQQLMLDWREYIAVLKLKHGSAKLKKACEAVAAEKAAREN